MRRSCFVFCVALIFSVSLSAQLDLGFKAGLSYTTLDGPSEIDALGNEAESFSMNSGFTLGLVFNYAITDLVGIRSELLYVQRNFNYDYEGNGYLKLGPGNTDLIAVGDKRTRFEVLNTYLDLPIQAYYRIGRFEITGGVNLAFLVASRAQGTRAFAGNLTETNAPVVLPQNQLLDYNYISDGPQGFVDGDAMDLGLVQNSGDPIFTPRRPGAYFEYPPSPIQQSSYYRRFEFALIGGLNFELNQGLYIGGRLHYGMSDITDNTVDISRAELNGQSLIFRDDTDTTIGFQVSIMFML